MSHDVCGIRRRDSIEMADCSCCSELRSVFSDVANALAERCTFREIRRCQALREWERSPAVSARRAISRNTCERVDCLCVESRRFVTCVFSGSKSVPRGRIRTAAGRCWSAGVNISCDVRGDLTVNTTPWTTANSRSSSSQAVRASQLPQHILIGTFGGRLPAVL
jgi:hypothetical protein